MQFGLFDTLYIPLLFHKVAEYHNQLVTSKCFDDTNISQRFIQFSDLSSDHDCPIKAKDTLR